MEQWCQHDTVVGEVAVSKHLLFSLLSFHTEVSNMSPQMQQEGGMKVNCTPDLQDSEQGKNVKGILINPILD